MNMNEHKIANSRLPHYGAGLISVVLGVVLLSASPLYAAEPAKTKAKKPVEISAVSASMSRSIPTSTEIVPQMELSPGQSHLIRLPETARLEKVSVDNPDVLQVTVTSLREVVLHAKAAGSTVVMIKDKSGQTTVIDVTVLGPTLGANATALQSKLLQLLPGEKTLGVVTAGDSLVLTGTVSDAVKVDKAMMIAEAYAGKKVVNLLKVSAPQQVMLEVKMAEVSKNILDKLGGQLNASRTNRGVSYAIAAGFLSLTGAGPLASSGGGLLTITHGKTTINIDAEDKHGVVKILAEPNIMAISGQEGSFLAGGKIFIPVPQGGSTGNSITLEEREFGVGLKFTPTVLEGDLINLRVAPEVSELSTTGVQVSLTGNSTTSVLPSFTTRRASTTVQLHDGQSFAIAGLIKGNVTESIRRFPILGDIPILGALFRSSEFQNDKTELLFVITPRLVKPLPPDYALPTDSFDEPSKKEFFLDGKLEGKPDTPDGAAVEPDKAVKDQPGVVEPAPQSDTSGYEMK